MRGFWDRTALPKSKKAKVPTAAPPVMVNAMDSSVVAMIYLTEVHLANTTVHVVCLIWTDVTYRYLVTDSKMTVNNHNRALLLAAESLLHYDKSLSLVKRTPDQEQLCVPQHLIWISGLVLCVCRDDSSQEELRNQFRRFQQLHHRFMNPSSSLPEHEILQWSPRLIPHDLSAIDAVLRIRANELHHQARIMAQQLFEEEDKKEKRDIVKVKKQSQKSASTAPVIPDMIPEEGEGPKAAAVSKESLNELLFKAPARSLVEEDERPYSWIPVHRKSKNKPTTTMPDCESNTVPSNDIPKLSTDPEPLVSTTPNHDEVREYQIQNVEEAIKEDLPSADDTNADPSTRIRNLQCALVAKELQLQKERRAFAEALTREKELAQDRLQGLQLRLYISETRLQTYEEALRQHVESVRNNLAPKKHEPIKTATLTPSTSMTPISPSAMAQVLPWKMCS